MDVLREVLLPKLESVRFSGGSWMAKCPAHEDGKASLHVSRGDRQPVVLKCHAGCEQITILDALGLTMADLCAPRDSAADHAPQGIRTEYDYVDEEGKLLFQVVRAPGKRFLQRVPDPAEPSGWRYRLGDTRRVLYRLPNVIRAVAEGELIYIAEGEKDVHSLEAAGVTGTCNPGGAGKWLPEFSEHFRDALVVVIADKDKPGQAHARMIADSLAGIASEVAIVEAAVGKDVSDHLAAGKMLAEMETTRPGATDGQPVLAPDLYEFLAEIDPAEEWVIPGLLERGDRLIWTGEEGLGKSMVSRQLAIAAAAGLHPFTDRITRPQRVLFVDCENPRRKSRRRFSTLEQVARHMRCPVPDGGFRIMHRPEGVDLSREEERQWLIERVTAHKPDLLVIGPLYKLHALDINEELAARVIVGVLDQARAINDCALIVEAHSPHGAEGHRALRPVGSSLFMRWPEFGYGIARAPKSEKHGPTTRRRVVVRSWRGPREEREWPRLLGWGKEGQQWPWIVLEEDDRDRERHLSAVPDAS